MKRLVLLLLLLSGPWAKAQDLAPWNNNTVKAWWDKHPAVADWSQGASDLDGQLLSYYQKQGASAHTDESFQNWLEFYNWLQLGVRLQDQLQNEANHNAFVTLGQPGSAGLLLARHLNSRDNAAEALKILLNLYQNAPADVAEFPALAVAYAVVFDQPFPKNWPHNQVEHSAVPLGDPDPLQRFAFYVQSCRNKKTEFDLRELEVPELIHLVDCPLRLEELAFAQKNRLPLSQFEHAFLDIQYDTPRLTQRLLRWTGDSYLLADIEKKGGICVDQAYHATITGKGRGIPTLYFSGEGSDGGHAWFGYLTHSGRWETDAGRYANQNFVVGYTCDPQSWQIINDAELTVLARCNNKNPNYRPAMTALTWALTHPGAAWQRQSLDEARTLMPDLPAPWLAEAAWLKQNNTDDSVAREFYEAWIKQFSNQRDMKLEGQELLLALLKRSNDPAAADLQSRMISENRLKRADLGIGAGFEGVTEKVEAKDWDGADQEYQKLVRRFAEKNGGNLLQNLVFPYVLACSKAGELPRAKKAVEYAEKRIPMGSESLLRDDFKKLHEGLEKAAAATQGN